MINVVLLTKKDEGRYTDFLLGINNSLIYYSLNYRELLKFLVGGEDIYIIAKEDDAIIGALPAFIKFNKRYGNVINSLPFYGSNGGFVVNMKMPVEKQFDVRKKLLNRFYELEKEYNCISSAQTVEYTLKHAPAQNFSGRFEEDRDSENKK